MLELIGLIIGVWFDSALHTTHPHDVTHFLKKHSIFTLYCCKPFLHNRILLCVGLKMGSSGWHFVVD